MLNRDWVKRLIVMVVACVLVCAVGFLCTTFLPPDIGDKVLTWSIWIVLIGGIITMLDI